MSLDFGDGVEELKITVLTTNTTDLTLPTDPKFMGKVIQPRQKTVAAIADHGLAMSIEVDGINILYDFGGMGFAILKNLEIFQVDPKIFQKAVLSHGHFDHFGSLLKLLPALGPQTDLIISPEIYKQKIGYLNATGEVIDLETLEKSYKTFKKEGRVRELPLLRKNLIEKTILDNNQTLIETRTPVQLAPGVWTSGEIEISDKSELTNNLFIKLDKTSFKEDSFRDEIAIYINVKNKGLVVLTGCGHTGIINTIKHGQKLSGINQIYAVIGGFHLIWSSENHLEKVTKYMMKINPEIVCGMHCTGFSFNAKLFANLPQNATLGVVGTTFLL